MKDQLIKQKDKEIIEMEAKLKSSNVASKVSYHQVGINIILKITYDGSKNSNNRDYEYYNYIE